MNKFFLAVTAALLPLLAGGCDTHQLDDPGLLVPKTVDEDPSLPSIFVNGTQLHAETYGDPHNPMIVVLQGGPGSVRVAVVDTGAGIPPEDLPHVFERFYRADKSRTPGSHNGAGLGLAIARQIVELHGSTLSVESRPGEGAEFSFSLRS